MTTVGPFLDVRPAASLPRRVLAGYSLGSLVTGAFGTVPGLLLLPYLTDTLGVAAGVAGLVVLVPKAWEVLVNPIALAEELGLGGGDFTRMAEVNALLNVAPPRLREALLTGFLSLLQRPAAATE